MAGVAAGAAAGVFFAVSGVRGAVGAHEETRVAARDGVKQGAAVVFGFEDGQAVVVWFDAADEQGVAVVEEVVRGDGRGEVFFLGADVGDGVRGGDVFEDDAQCRVAAAQRVEHGVDEGGFAVEDVDAVGRYFAVDKQQQARLGDGIEDGVKCGGIGHALGGVGGRAFGIPFDGDDAGGFSGAHGVHAEIVAEVEAHQWGEAGARRNVGGDAFAVGGDGVDAVHRRGEVGHDEGAGALARGVRHGAGEGGAVAQVDVQVVRGGQGEGLGHVRVPVGDSVVFAAVEPVPLAHAGDVIGVAVALDEAGVK